MSMPDPPDAAALTQPAQLLRNLPQRPPALLVDTIHQVSVGKSVVGSVTFPPGHRVFDGHLPGNPLVPGVALIEALAQVAGVALMAPGGSPIRGYLAEVNRMRFLRLIRPGESIDLSATLDAAFGSLARFAVEATVAGEIAAKGLLTVVAADAPPTSRS